MDVIVSAAFGFEVDSQNNPDDGVLKATQLAMNQTTFQKILFGVLSFFDAFWTKNYRKSATTVYE